MWKAFLNTLVSGAICWSSGVLVGPAEARAEERTFLVLGVIASAQEADGVALLKAMPSGETFAVRIGQEIDHILVVERITRDYVYVRLHGKSEKVRVGDQVEQGPDINYAQDQAVTNISSGIERHGDTVKISAALRDAVTKDQLNKVLMQAAALPYFVNGQLYGFRLWEIEVGSIYQKAGFIDGDIITAVNGQALTDVAMTIRLLQSIRNEPKAEINFTRQGVEQRIELIVAG